MSSRLPRVALSACFLIALPIAVEAQGPPVEVTAQGAAETGGGGIAGWSPRVSLRLGENSSLETAALFRPVRPDRFGVREGARSLDVVLRQTLWARDRLEVFGLVGATWQHQIIDFDVSRFEQDTGGAQVGLAARWVMHPRLALRGDIRSMVGEDASLSGSLGVSMPLGRYSETRRLDRRVHDPVWNGMGIGAALGGGTGAVTGALLGRVVCESDDCSGVSIGMSAALAVMGSALGSVVGGVVDSLWRRPGG